MLRGFCTWLVICPKLAGLVMSRPGAPQLAWFRALKNSDRNMRYFVSVNMNFFEIEASKLKKLGARRIPTPELPSSPGAEIPKEQVPLSTPAAQKLAALFTGPKKASTVCVPVTVNGR